VSPANPLFSWLRFPGKTAVLCRLARQVLAGNAFLASYARRFNPRVSVVPTTIDTDRYSPSLRRPGSVPVIGWTGSYSTARYLEALRPVLQRLGRRHEFRVVVVGAPGLAADGVEVEARPWRSASEVSDLADIDIGVMPLDDTEWERGKCGLKALQYMALGIPAVASPVGVNVEIVRDGENGLLAASDEEWERALERLLADAGLRRRLGDAGRATVESGYSARVHAPRVAAVFRDALRSA
jgi:glycosyltransferase involved in cell wall biosynthesis